MRIYPLFADRNSRLAIEDILSDGGAGLLFGIGAGPLSRRQLGDFVADGYGSRYISFQEAPKGDSAFNKTRSMIGSASRSNTHLI